MVDRLTGPLDSEIVSNNIFEGTTTWQDDLENWVSETRLTWWLFTAEFLFYLAPLAARYFWRVKVEYPELWSEQTYWYL